MEMEELSEVGFEVRDELMITPTGDGKPTLRLAHFIKPTINSIDEPVFELPSHCRSYSPPTFEPRNWPLKLNFNAWRMQKDNWKKWVYKMASLHQQTWKKAGIHEAIFNSTYKINKNKELIFGLAEKWCPQTNSFIFSWGEATITLEDVMSFGFSVLGSPVCSSLETEELKMIEEKLNQVKMELNRDPTKHAYDRQWLKKFMDSGSDVEHEAFLALWLSRFVFPSTTVIVKSLFPIAIHLAKGTKIALAPAILASIYRDLSLLKENIVCLTKTIDHHPKLKITIRSQFQLVLIWAWERFVELRPKPNLIGIGEPRFAQWHDLSMRVENVRMVFDSAKESFDWRPYCKTVKNWSLPKFYAEKEMWVSVGADLCVELKSFARCLRVCKLTGFDCLENYFPHRVAMQFGMDQDLPPCVARATNHSRSIAWSYYNKPISCGSLYIPSRLFEADVTTRYLDWWKQSMSRLQAESRDVLNMLPLLGFKRKRVKEKTTKRTKRMRDVASIHSSLPLKNVEKSQEMSKWKEKDSFPLGSPLKEAEKSVQSLKEQKKVSDTHAFVGLAPIIVKAEFDDLLVPPGFPPKSKLLQEKDSSDEDNMTISELLKSRKKNDAVGNRQVGIGEKLCGQSLSSTIAGNVTVEHIKKQTDLVEKSKRNELVKGTGSERAMKDASDSTANRPNHGRVEIQNTKGDGDEDDPIEALLCRVEKISAELKAYMFSKITSKATTYALAHDNEFPLV